MGRGYGDVGGGGGMLKGGFALRRDKRFLRSVTVVLSVMSFCLLW